MRAEQPIYTLNRGVVDRRGLARADVKRLQMAAEVQTNWLPKVLGYMGLRPGTAYLGGVLDDLKARFLKFIFATDDTAAIELTDLQMRIWIDDEVLERTSVGTTITNGEFTSDISGWTDYDAGGTASTWNADGYMQLQGDGTSRAAREQQVTVALADRNKEHGIRIDIRRGPVSLRIGSSSGDDDLQRETVLTTGLHSIAITPAGNFFIRFFSSQLPVVWVNRCVIESAGAVVLDTPWTEDDLPKIRYDQSGDVVFVACTDRQQRRIERRGDHPGGRSWSLALYQAPDGPFKLQNVTPTTITPSDLTGNITLTASADLFKGGHVGALFSLSSNGQTVTVDVSAEDTWSPSVRVTGIENAREVTFVVSGTYVGTATVQRSFDNATWATVPGISFPAPATDLYNDGLDNAIAYYRIGIALGDYTSGTATCMATIPSGTIRGVVRVTDFTSSTVVGAEVLSDLGGTDATDVWEEGQWSTHRGFPMAVAIHEGRMWWAGLNGIWGSISDAYDSFDQTFTGDAGPINRTVGSGPVDTINWLMSLKGLALGAQGAEYLVRASSLDEPLTPTNFNVKASTTQGSGNVGAVKIDQAGYFVDRTGCKVFEISFDVRSYDFAASDLMQLCPEIALAGIIRMDVQRKPDTRIHLVLADGTALIGVISRAEEVLAWIPIETDGLIEDVIVLPADVGALDDRVYYAVKRTIDGTDRRYFERWAQEIDCRGGDLTLLADCHVTYSGAARTVIQDLDHLEGEEVVVWADSADVGTDDSGETWTQIYTVSGGEITLAVAASTVVVGLGYQALFKSSKLGLQPQGGTSLNRQKNIDHIGLILADTHRKGIRFGPSFDVLDDMPQVEEGTEVTEEVREDYDQDSIEFPGTWTTNLRVCIVGQAPRPATVMGVTPGLVQT